MTQSALSWFSNQPISIRDDGEEEFEGEFEDKEKKVLKIDPATGFAANPPRSARAAWPEGAYVRLRSMVKGRNYELAEKWARRAIEIADPTVDSGPERPTDTWYAPLVYCAVFIQGFVCIHDPKRPELAVFEDDYTCLRRERQDGDDDNPAIFVPEDEEDEPNLVRVRGTGKDKTMPRGMDEPDLLERLEVVRDIPLQAILWINGQITERAQGPLPGTVPVVPSKKGAVRR